MEWERSQSAQPPISFLGRLSWGTEVALDQALATLA